LLCLDPGETVGWALWDSGDLIECGQFRVADTLNELVMFVSGTAPDQIVMENYRVYGHRAQQHVGSEVVTIQYIGVIKLVAEQLKIPITLQMAWQAKQFNTDAKLRAWGLHRPGMVHANDAIRHGCYYYLFNKAS